jgi:hypothetical protein
MSFSCIIKIINLNMNGYGTGEWYVTILSEDMK